METLLFRIIWAGFVLLTLTLASGIVFSEELFGKRGAVQSQDRVRHSVVDHLRARCSAAGIVYGWRGRIAVRWTLAGFLMLVLAYVGSKFVLEVILGRGLIGSTSRFRGRNARRCSIDDVLLVAAVAFFSIAETAMMALNRYRLQVTSSRKATAARGARRELLQAHRQAARRDPARQHARQSPAPPRSPA